MASLSTRWWFYPVLFLISLGLVFVAVIALTLALLYPNLPSLEALTDYRPKIPLRIYSADSVLLGEFGEERRALIKINEVPTVMKQAILAAEDERFYQHGGVDYVGVARAALANLTAGGVKKEGASTITMQVARNFLLNNEKTFTRKLAEVLLAFKIEQNLSKDQILELYINQIFLGQRAYGFAAAANIYYGKDLKDLTPAEVAMLAGLPKAPSRYNPIINPKRAQLRQQYVLRRMRELHFLTDAQYAEAVKQPLKFAAAAQSQQALPVHAEYVAEMARQAVYERFGEAAYTGGYRVYTTILKADQEAAYLALRRGVMEYDRRHGYRGPEGHADFARAGPPSDEDYEDALQDKESSGDLVPAVAIEASPKAIRAYVKGGETITITGDGLKFASRALSDKAPESYRIIQGSIIRVFKDEKDMWQIAQMPAVSAALVSMVPQDGAVRALVGGFDFNINKFNHVAQAWRQPGSSFKPFIYSAALEKGFTPATIVNDAPIVFDAAKTGSDAWEPKNYDGKYDGPIRLRTALAKSKNMVSIRILQGIGPRYAQDYIARFGFDPKLHPPYLTMALGAGSVTPLQMAGAYSVFANGGYQIKPYYILRVVDQRGNVVMETKPPIAGQDAERVIDPRNAFIMTSLLRDVIRYGTGAKAMALGRQDLAGKTGTTNDSVDAWFAGFNDSLVAVTWIGFDNPASLGDAETGGGAALPIWMGYMAKALKGVPETPLTPPDGVVALPINPQTGLQQVDAAGAMTDYFYQEFLPGRHDAELGLKPEDSEKPQEEIKNQLF